MRFKTMVSRGGDPDVLLVGDSLIKGLNRYANVWRKYFGSMQCLNFGIGGDRVQHVLWRLRHGELNCDPKVIVIHCGTNNIGKDTPKEIAEGLLTIVDQISMDCPYTRTIVTGLLPRDLEPSDFRNDIAEVNKLLMENIEFSDEMKNVFFLETAKDWILASGRLDESLYFTDCLHLVEAGDEKFAKGIREKIDEVLKIVENDKVLLFSRRTFMHFLEFGLWQFFCCILHRISFAVNVFERF
jgi:lysophospholipase L1-like esterase